MLLSPRRIWNWTYVSKGGDRREVMSLREAISIGLKFFFVGLILFSAFWAQLPL